MNAFSETCDTVLRELNTKGQIRPSDKMIATRLIDDGYAIGAELPYGKREKWHLLKPTHRGIAFAEKGGYKWANMKERWAFWGSKYGVLINATVFVGNIIAAIYTLFFACP